MWIIIEGCTAAGKSTLFEDLKTRMGSDTETVHFGQPEDLTRRYALNQYVGRWEARQTTDPKNILADRWAWGEMTYAPVYRPDTNYDGYGLLGVAGWRWTEMFLASRGATTVYLSANNETLENRLKTRGDDHVTTVEDLLRISSLYEGARRESLTLGGALDTTGIEDNQDGYTTLVESVLTEAQRREDASLKLMELWPGYIGSLNPSVLLVGDRRNVGKKHGQETILPFMPVDSNSGDFLLGALPDMVWRTTGIINGTETKNLVGLIKALGSPTVIALGNEARDCLNYSKIDFEVTMPHPQWVRRFRHDSKKEYGEAIAGAISGDVPDTWIL